MLCLQENKDVTDNNLKIFERDVFSFPIRRHHPYFPEALRISFQNYKEAITYLDDCLRHDLIEFESRISLILRELQECVSVYYQGQTAKAFIHLTEAIQALEGLIGFSGHETMPYETTHLYRMRTGGPGLFEKHEMFHIPFEERNKVKTQRYSIPGLPCLYLGNTAYVCWEELRKPSLWEMQVSRFELPSRTTKFLDLTIMPLDLFHLIRYDPGLIEKYYPILLKSIVSWPLVIACSFISDDTGAHFIPEHIIPQFLLEWVRMHGKFHGVKYPSTRLQHSRGVTGGINTNYVIPVLTTEPVGLCKGLAELLPYTDAISWQMLNVMNPLVANQNADREAFYMPGCHRVDFVEFRPKNKVEYRNTVFGKIELELRKRIATRL